MSERRAHGSIRFAVFFFLASAVFPSLSRARVPVFKITTEDSSIKFAVKASVAINGTFDKWDATPIFASTDVSTGVLDIKIQADSVNTGSSMKDGKLKSEDFFNADQDPLITFLFSVKEDRTDRPHHLRCAGRFHDTWSDQIADADRFRRGDRLREDSWDHGLRP